MDGRRFDELSRRLARRQSRRGILALIGASAAGVLTQPAASAAPKDDKPQKCYGEGSPCTNGKQCCSNICTNRLCAADVETECTVASDCTGFDSECQTRTCIDGMCGTSYTSYGVPTSDQIAGDCRANVCNGAGGVVTIADDADIPPANDCMSASCTDGVPSTSPLPAGTSCAIDGGVICNGAGRCVVCIPGETRPCYSGPAGTENVGICHAGTKTCRPDGSGFDGCVGEVVPMAELCNNLDDDCDGTVDNDVSGIGNPCSLGLPPFLPPECNRGTVQCLDGQYRCCSITCTDVGSPLCV
jgi:hypothetical protein